MHNTIKGLIEAAAKYDVRYYLNGICVERLNGEVRLIATDGHMLSMVKLSENHSLSKQLTEDGQWIVSSSSVKEALKICHKKSTNITFEDGKFFLVSTFVRAELELIDGTFPDWRRVIKEEKIPTSFFYLSDTINKRVAQVANLLNGTTGNACKYEMFGDNQTVKVTIMVPEVAVTEAFVVAMTCRWAEDTEKKVA